MTIAEWLFSPSGLTPHGFCLTWAPGLLWLHATSDAVTAAAYFSIPLALARFVSLRRDLQYHWVAYLFGAFILACGLTHVMSIYTLWVPAYGVEGLIKLVTALLSIATAAILWPLIPRLVALPSPEELHSLNGRLSETVVEQARTAALLRESESRVRAINMDLERRVAERTADLSAANARLVEALAERTAAEAAMRESEQRLRLAVDGAQLGVWEMNFAENRGRLDARSAEMTGAALPAETWLALDGPEFAAWVGRIHPDDRALRDEAVKAVRDGARRVVQMEYRVQRPDGVWMSMTHWRAVVERDPSTGLPTRALGIILDTTERARAEAEIRAALGQRDLLLREVYHRVKNNLQIVDGLLLLQSRDLTDPQAAQTLLALRSRIYALGLVHAQLMASKNLETFDIAPFLHELTHNIVAGGGNPEVRLEVTACSLEVDLDFAVPLGLLVTELVTNSLKHAFSDRPGVIAVTLCRDTEAAVTLTVADDGPGADSPRGKPGIGESIVAGLVRQLSGSIMIDGTKGRLTTIVVPGPEFA
jgi:two-component sensor histidine kinase/PAS domain-containing protein